MERVKKKMKIDIKIPGIIYTAVMSMVFMSINAAADEIGIATGLNVSAYKFWTDNSATYQKTNILNPIEITYQKDLIKFFGIYSSLQFSKRSRSYLRTDYSGKSTYSIKYEKELNYFSLEISPILSYRLNHIQIGGRLGVSGNLYINETWANSLEEESATARSKDKRPFVLSFVSGIGLGYIIKDRFNISLRSSISRTLTDIYKDQAEDMVIYYLNFHNVICFGFLF